MKERTPLQKQVVKPVPMKHPLLDELKPTPHSMSISSGFHTLSSKSKEASVKTEKMSPGCSQAVSQFHGNPGSTMLKASQGKGESLSSVFRTPASSSNHTIGNVTHAIHPSATALKSSTTTTGKFHRIHGNTVD